MANYRVNNNSNNNNNNNVCGLERDEILGGRRKLHDKEFHNLYSTPIIIKIFKSRMRWAGHVARMERRGVRVKFW
jgi:hypothetical protein